MGQFSVQSTLSGSYHEDQFGNKVNANGRPTDLIDPRDKDKDWILAMIKSIYVDYNRYYPSMFFNNRVEWDENIMYLQGLVNPGRYMQMYDQNQAETRNLSTVNYDKRFLNVISKYFRILKGKLSDVEFHITATPENALARQHTQEFKNKIDAATQIKLLAESQNIPQLLDVLRQAGMDDIPTDDIEYQIKMQNSMPYQCAMDLEMYLDYISDLCKLPQQLQEIDYDLITCGVAAMEEAYDANGNPMSKRVDPRSLLVGWSNTEDFRDISEIGKFRMVTMNDITKEDVNGDLAGQYETIEQLYIGRYGNQMWYPDNQVRGFRNMDPVYAKNRVLVLDVYFYSYNEDVYIARPNKNTGNRFVEKVTNTKGVNYYKGREDEFKLRHPEKEIYRTRTKNIYKGTWIIGSDYMYNYGLYRNMARTKDDPTDTILPIVVTAPLMRNGKAVSIVEEIKPIADAANLMWQKMQDATAHARPPGFQFDPDALYDATKALASDNYNFEKVMQNILVHNIVPMSSKNLAGVNSGNRPYEERMGGLGPDFNQYVEGLKFYLYLLQEITGFNNVAAGGDVQYTGKEVANLAVNSADYSIKHLFEAKKDMYQSLMKLKAMMGMDSIAEGKAVGIKKALGGAFEFFQINKEVSLYDYGIKIEFRPTAQEWQRLDADIQRALALPLDQGGITMLDAGRIRECETIKQANAYLYVAIKKNMQQAQQSQLEQAQQKSQMDQQTAQLSQQAQMAQLQAQQQLEMQTVAFTEEEKRKTLREQYAYELELKKLEGLIKSSQVIDQGHIDKTITQLKVEGNMDRLKGKTMQIGS